MANSILVKVNQIGSLTKPLMLWKWRKRLSIPGISHRLETEDVTIADISVATNAGQIKTGSSLEPIVSVNIINFAIEEQFGDQAVYGGKI